MGVLIGKGVVIKKNTFEGWRIFKKGALIGNPGGGVLNISLGGEVRRGPSYPDPV